MARSINLSIARAALFPYALSLPALVIVVGLVVIPLLTLGVYSFWSQALDGRIDATFTLKTWATLFEDAFVAGVMFDTFRLAFGTMLICGVVGYGPAYFMTIVSPRWRGILAILLFLPSWISYVVRTMSWIPILGKTGIINTALTASGITSAPLALLYNEFSIYMGLVHYLLPLMILNIYLGLLSVEPSVIAAARTLGANQYETFIRIIFPLSVPGLSAGCLLCFILSLGTFVTPKILGSPGMLFYGNLVYETIVHQIDWPTGAMLSLVIIFLLIALLYIYSRFLNLSTVLRAVKS